MSHSRAPSYRRRGFATLFASNQELAKGFAAAALRSDPALARLQRAAWLSRTLDRAQGRAPSGRARARGPRAASFIAASDCSGVRGASRSGAGARCAVPVAACRRIAECSRNVRRASRWGPGASGSPGAAGFVTQHSRSTRYGRTPGPVTGATDTGSTLRAIGGVPSREARALSSNARSTNVTQRMLANKSRAPQTRQDGGGAAGGAGDIEGTFVSEYLGGVSQK